MVAIIRCIGDEEEHIEFYRRLLGEGFPEWTWATNRPRRLWRAGSHLTLVITGISRGNPQVSKLAWARRMRQVDDLNQKLELSRIYSVVPALDLHDLLNSVPGRNRRDISPEGQQPEKAGEALRDAMLELRPGWRQIVENIEGAERRISIGTTASAQILAFQRDASIGIVRMAGMDLPEFKSWSPSPDPLSDSGVPPNFIAGIPEGRAAEDKVRAHEDQLIGQDMRTMLGLLTEATAHVNWRAFNQYGRTLLIANANREPAEEVLGADIIYYNITRGSLVLVQYKKLDAATNGRYYPNSDKNLDKELRRMRALDRYVASKRRSADEFRLLSSPSWLKICHPLPYVPRSNDMIHGIYLARGHFEQLRNDPRLKGKNGGISFSYKTVPSYLDNTMFTKLVETGLIGTAGVSTDLVHQQIVRSFTGKKALALGVLQGDDLTQSERNRRRRDR